VTSYLKWSLYKSDPSAPVNGWSSSHQDLELWDTDNVMDIPTDAGLSQKLVLKMELDGQLTVRYSYGSEEWTSLDQDDGKVPHCSGEMPVDGLCAQTGQERFCDRRIVATFRC
jgi:hypothetical protein